MFAQLFLVMARTWCPARSVCFFGPGFRQIKTFFAIRSNFVNGLFLSLGVTVYFPPWDQFFDFSFLNHGRFRKKNGLLTVGAPSAHRWAGCEKSELQSVPTFLLGKIPAAATEYVPMFDPISEGISELFFLFSYLQMLNIARKPKKAASGNARIALSTRSSISPSHSP